MSATFVCNPKFGNVQFSSPFGQLSKLRNEKNENSFDWRTLHSSQLANSLDFEQDRNVDEMPSTEAVTADENLISPSSQLLSPVSPESKISSLYSDFYTSVYKDTLSLRAIEEPLDAVDEESYEAIPTKATDQASRLDTDYVYLDNPLPVDVEQSVMCQPSQPSVIIDEQNPEDIPLSMLAPVAILDSLILRFCKMRLAGGLSVILSLDSMTGDSLPGACSILLECSECLMPSIEMVNIKTFFNFSSFVQMDCLSY